MISLWLVQGYIYILYSDIYLYSEFFLLRIIHVVSEFVILLYDCFSREIRYDSNFFNETKVITYLVPQSYYLLSATTVSRISFK